MSLRVGNKLAVVLGASLLATSAYAQDASYLSMSLEEITEIEVTSVSKKSEKASEAAAAIHVITNEDLIRSGAVNIAEALRMVPGMQVAKGGSAQWAVSARGFNDQFANKLLVLIDGRTVYTPNFSGVWWDVQNLIMEDVERIEVIRGPGATLWGANAVNGVINVITKKAEDTQGTLVKAGGGNNRKVFGEARYGGKFGQHGHMRAYVKHDHWDEGRGINSGTGADDEWRMTQAGFRSDFDDKDGLIFTVQGDLYAGEQDQSYVAPLAGAPFQTSIQDDQTMRGANVLARWSKVISERSNVTIQSYIDYASRDIVFVDMANTTFDLEVQHDYQMNDWANMTWGVGYRFLDDNLDGGPYLSFTPTESDRHEFNAFMQSKVELMEDWSVTLGSKFEHNEFTDFEVQPSIRSAFLISDKQTLWGSVSRAVRTPSRAAQGLTNVVAGIPAFGNGLVIRYGQPGTESEELLAYELGYRAQPTDALAFDIAAFYNDYDNLIVNQTGATSLVVGDPAFGAYTLLPLTLVNGGGANVYGVELSTHYNPTLWWKWAASYSFTKMDLEGNGQFLPTNARTTPQHQGHIRSFLQLSDAMQFDQALYYVDQIAPDAGTSVPNYWRLDLRLAMQIKEHLELTVVGQNLLDGEHPEFSNFLYNSQAQVPRSVYGQLKWEF